MTQKIKAACIQLCTGRNIEENNKICGDLIREAANAGATFVATPEMTSLMELSGKHLDGKAYLQEECPSLKFYQYLAEELSIYILLGSIAIKIGEQKYTNRSFLIAKDGSVIAHYDKIHMFDVEVSKTEKYFESKYYEAGDQLSYIETEDFKLGQTICFDLRFAKMFQDYASLGANIITVPSAFTVPTGKAHWHILLRARAIETNSFIIAPAQGGEHENGRKTYGHSLIVSPWGEILAESDGVETGYIIAELDLAEVGRQRKKMPVVGKEINYQTQITRF